MASKYQKEHHEDVAKILADVRRTWQPDIRFDGFTNRVCQWTMNEFAELFAIDNPLFDRERFLKACGLES